MAMNRPRILLIENHDDTRVLYTQALEATGHAVYAVTDFDEALHVIESAGRIDVIVLDIGLRGDGLAFAERVPGTWTRLIAVTGRTRTGDPRERLFTAYFLKPVFPDTLVIAVKEALRRGPMGP
jgi:CheY-like chemotaxis protein